VTEAAGDGHREFAGKVALVTGGAAGIGFAIARAFARAGASVALAGRTQETLTHSAAAIMDESGGEAFAIRADVGDPSDCERMLAATVARFGALDILVNNAALFAPVPLIEVGGDEALRAFIVNVVGPLSLARAFAKWTIARSRKGVIVNVSTIAAARPSPGLALYSASKAALESLTRSMALEWTRVGLRVNAVAPGHVNTEGVLEDFRAGRLDQKVITAHIPAGRIADVDDIAEAVMFLASARARHIAGQVLTVDGGEGF
jgi:NAD(P)-dependent dehydrogenase (short-subunit alcohol dehydrogenase family)